MYYGTRICIIVHKRAHFTKITAMYLFLNTAFTFTDVITQEKCKKGLKDEINYYIIIVRKYFFRRLSDV